MRGYLTESLAPVKRQKTDSDPFLPEVFSLFMFNSCQVKLAREFLTSRATPNVVPA